MTIFTQPRRALGTSLGPWNVATGDVLLAVGATVLGYFVVTSAGVQPAGGTAAGVAMVLVALTVLARRPAPVAGLAALVLADLFNVAVFGQHTRCGAVLPIAAYLSFSAARRAEDRGGVVKVVALAAAVGAITCAYELGAGGIVACVLVLGGSVAGGRVVRRRDGAVTELDRRTRALEAQREQTARLAVETERARIGGDVGAVVAERLAAVLEQARDGGPGDAARFAAIEQEGRAGLTEMRRVVDGLAGGVAPQPTLARLDAQLAADRERALLEVDGDRRPLAPGVEVAACRIVELLLGVVDPGDAGVRVRVRYGADEVVVELDAGGRAAAATTPDPALLAAARERVAAVGGSIDLRGGLARVMLPAAAGG
jgi:signal transduction histidine kinase